MIRGTAVSRILVRYTVCCIARQDEYCYIKPFFGIARSSQGNTVTRVALGASHNAIIIIAIGAICKIGKCRMLRILLADDHDVVRRGLREAKR